MYKDPSVWDRINSFALVSYIPEPLAGFLDRLRQELVPNCFLRAHVTILPPRPVTTSPEDAWDLIRNLVPRFRPFDLQLSSIDVFPISDVIYVALGAGKEQLIELHTAMNVGGLQYKELYPYSPHVTLAQELQPDEMDELARVARIRWEEFAFGKTYRVDQLVFVQNTRRKEWIDLGECKLGLSESKLVGELTDLLVG